MNAGTSVTLQPGDLKIYTAVRHTLPNVPNSYSSFATGGIDKVKENSVECNVYPTVATDFLHIDTDEEIQDILVVNMKGYTYPRTMMNNSIKVSDLENGQYLIIVTFAQEQQAYRFVKR